MTRVSVENEVCVGCCLCESSCPDVFEMQGVIAIVKRESLSVALVECVKGVAAACPVAAIHLME